MRRKNTKRAILSFARGARQETMSHAWGRERIGRSARQSKRFKARALYEASDRRAEKSKAAHTRCRKPDRRNRSVTFLCRLKLETGCRRLVSFTGEHWSLTTLREKLVKIGAKVVAHGHYVTFQLAEVAVPSALFAEKLRTRPPSGRYEAGGAGFLGSQPGGVREACSTTRRVTEECRAAVRA